MSDLGGERIANMGEMTTTPMLENGALGSLKFNGAKVRKPLLAVSGVVDKGNLTIFDKDSFIVPGSVPEVKEIRRLINAIKNKIPLHRRGGVYTMRAWQAPSSWQPPARTGTRHPMEVDEQGFMGQGR